MAPTNFLSANMPKGATSQSDCASIPLKTSMLIGGGTGDTMRLIVARQIGL